MTRISVFCQPARPAAERGEAIRLTNGRSWCASSPKDPVIAHHPHTLTIRLTRFCRTSRTLPERAGAVRSDRPQASSAAASRRATITAAAPFQRPGEASRDRSVVVAHGRGSPARVIHPSWRRSVTARSGLPRPRASPGGCVPGRVRSGGSRDGSARRRMKLILSVDG